MPTNNNFLNGLGTDNAYLTYIPSNNSFTRKLKFTNPNDIVTLANYIISPDVVSSIFTNPTDWLSTLMWYPFNVNEGSTPISAYLKIGPTELGKNNVNDRISVEEINPYTQTYFTLGEYYVEPYFNNFADYNGYTKIQIYLPFYQFIDVLPNDVMGKYIQFRLGVDYNTGTATYYIGVSDNSITNTSVIPSSDESSIRILSTHSFQLGVQLPLGSVNTSDVYRNIVLGAVKSMGVASASYAMGLVGGGVSNSTTTSYRTASGQTDVVSPKSGRILKNPRTWSLQDSRTTSRTYDNTSYYRANAVSEVFNSSTNSLNAMHVSASSDRPNNSLANIRGSLSIQIVIIRPKLHVIDNNYNHLYGVPLGETVLISTLVGYSEISSVHFEGVNFGSCTSTEYAMISQAFADGVLL